MSSNHNFQDKPSSEVEAQVLSRIMVLQDMLGSFTEQESMFEFICRGLEEVPGVGEVTNRLSTEKLETEGDTREGFKYFPVFMDRTHFGTLIFEVLDEGRFEPYAPFIQNLCFLTAVVLEERRQRELKEQYSLDLEQRVRRRTRELEASRARTEMERNRAEKYLEVSESLIVELDADLEILTINQHAATIIGYSSQELMETKWVELLHGDSHPKEVREGLEKLLSGVSEEFAYSEYALKAKNGNKLIISWHNVPRPASWNGGIGLLLSGSDVTERKHAEEEKAVLLREVYHRTKNNMSIIISLLTLQGGQIENPIFQQMLLDTRNRILSMAIVHSKLYSSQSLARIGLVEYVRELSSNLLVTFYGSSEAVYMAIQGEDVLVDLETAVPTGLVINEILTNAFKHAFSETQGRRKIKLDIREESGYICVEYQDNGCGLPEAVLLKHGGGLGMQLIDNIVRHQLNGTVTLQNINGTHISLTIQKGAQ